MWLEEIDTLETWVNGGEVNNPAQRAGLLKKFKTTSSSKTSAQGVVVYSLEQF